MLPDDFLTFISVIFVLTVTPGADMAVVARVALAGGLAHVWPTLAGIFSGLAVHIALSITGLSLAVAHSPTAFTAVKVAGAGYLCWLGLSTIWATRTQRDGRSGAEQKQAPAVSRTALWRAGFLTNLLNVKIGLFYIALLPQFASTGNEFVASALTVAAIQAVCGFSWLLFYGLLVSRAGAALGDSPTRRWLERASGVTLVALSLRLATVTSHVA